MFGKLKKLFSRKPKEARKPKPAEGAPAQAAAPAIDAKAYRRIRSLRLDLARDRLALAGGDATKVRDVRQGRRQLAQAEASLAGKRAKAS